jgi:histidine ammonia-lyase
VGASGDLAPLAHLAAGIEIMRREGGVFKKKRTCLY